MENTKKRFIGPNEVFGVTIQDDPAVNGDELLEVSYENREIRSELMPKALFEKLISEAPYDYNALREKRTDQLLKDLTRVCLEHAMKYSDLKYVCASLNNKLMACFDRATNFLWTKDDKQFVPGADPLDERTLLDAEVILQGINKNGESAGEGKENN